MSSISYQHLILISKDSSVNISNVYAKIKRIDWVRKNVVDIKSFDNSILIPINGWRFEIGINSSEHVLIESQEMADEFAKGHELHNQIKECDRRFEIGGDPDYDMNFFNDFCLILGQIESFNGVFTFNPHEGFLNI